MRIHGSADMRLGKYGVSHRYSFGVEGIRPSSEIEVTCLRDGDGMNDKTGIISMTFSRSEAKRFALELLRLSVQSENLRAIDLLALFASTKVDVNQGVSTNAGMGQ